jgi:hypothetical protein
MGNCGSGAANRADDGVANGPDQGAANRAAVAAVTTSPATATEVEEVATEAVVELAEDQDAENRADHGVGNRTWYYELAGDGLGEKSRRGHVAASEEVKDVLSAIVRREWNLEVEVFGRTIQLYATPEDMNNGTDPLNEGERLAGNIGNQSFPLIARICNTLSEGKVALMKPNLIHARLTHIFFSVTKIQAAKISMVRARSMPPGETYGTGSRSHGLVPSRRSNDSIRQIFTKTC